MAITALYVATTGADTNGGSSEGAAIVSGASADTDGTTTVSLLDDTPDLSGVSVGDSIRLAAETGGGQGSASEVFEITAVDNGGGVKTVTVTPTPGTNLNQAWVIGGAFATIDHAANTVVAGNKVWVKATADYTETVTIDTAGTAAAPITFEGYTTTIGDNGQATIKDSTDGITQASGAAHFYIFRNFIITGHSDKGVDLANTGDNVTFENCNIHTNTGIGVAGDNFINLIRCQVQNNGGQGTAMDGGGVIIGCVISGNGGHGLAIQNTQLVIGCLIYDNTNGASAASAIVHEGGNTALMGFVIGNTIDGDASSVAGAITLLDVDQSDFPLLLVYNNILFDGDTGIILQTPDRWGRLMDYNVMDDISGTKRTFITAGDNDIDDPTTIGLNADYTLTSASEAKGAGIDAGLLENGTSFIDIGALQRAEAGGGGGGCKQAGSSGGMVG